MAVTEKSEKTQQRIYPIGRSGPTIYRRDLQKMDGRWVRAYGWTPQSQAVFRGDLNHEQRGGAHLRWHPLREEWSVYAAHRQHRPNLPRTGDDPLAPMRSDGDGTEIPLEDFEIVVFDNGFPSFSFEAEMPAATGAYEAESARGRCEVVVYQASADGSLATIGTERRELLVLTWIDRCRELHAAGCKFVMPFENRGEEVGVTLHHPHGQIYGFPVVPAPQATMARAFANGFSLEKALPTQWQGYSVAESPTMAALVPPFARFPYEVWIVPIRRRASIVEFNTGEVRDLAGLLGDVATRYDDFFGQACPYMMTIQNAPVGSEESFHMTAQFYPLLRGPGERKYMASVENATGIFTVDVLPEAMAEELRSA